MNLGTKTLRLVKKTISKISYQYFTKLCICSGNLLIKLWLGKIKITTHCNLGLTNWELKKLSLVKKIISKNIQSEFHKNCVFLWCNIN